MSQVISHQASEVIGLAQERRQSYVSLSRDEWLAGISSSPKSLLDRMDRDGALVSVGAGVYVLPRLGQGEPEYLPWQSLVHSRLSKGGDYYLSGLTALAEHRLTDLSPKQVRAVLGYKSRSLESREVEVGSRTVSALSSMRSGIFGSVSGIEKVRLSKVEHYFRSDFERTLVDSLWKPQQFGSPETWLTAWGRGSHELDVERAAAYASRLGPASMQRLGVILDLIDKGDEAHTHIDRKRFEKRRIASLVANRPEEPDAEIDRYWRVSFNIPRNVVEGWLLYER